LFHQRWSRERVLHAWYLVGIWFKGIDGILEVIGGTLFLLVSKGALNHWVAALTQHELVEDPTDWVATHLQHAVSHLSTNTKLFASAYLLGHGAIKVFLVWGGLLREKLWAFPTALLFIGAFMGYQTFRLFHRFSFTLTALTVIDCLILLLISHEYLVLRNQRRN
jgi:uncharacterized membrane protein